MLRTWIVIAVLVHVGSVAYANDSRDFSGIVTKIFDGDSFLVAASGARGHEIEVRLMDVDAPEKNQPYADVARSALTKLIGNRRVFVDVVTIDKYDRKVAKVYREPDRIEVTRSLVREGHVWVNGRYAKDRSLIKLEAGAKSKSLGLWALPERDRIPPWDFRRQERKRRSN